MRYIQTILFTSVQLMNTGGSQGSNFLQMMPAILAACGQACHCNQCNGKPHPDNQLAEVLHRKPINLRR